MDESVDESGAPASDIEMLEKPIVATEAVVQENGVHHHHNDDDDDHHDGDDGSGGVKATASDSVVSGAAVADTTADDVEMTSDRDEARSERAGNVAARHTVTNPSDLWVETKTEEGKSYFYHAMSRETTWTRPEGPNVKIMNQLDVEALMLKNQQQQQQNQQQQQQQQQLNMAERAEEATQKAAAEAAMQQQTTAGSTNENGQATMHGADTAAGIQGVDSTTNLATPTQEQNKAHDSSIPSFQQMAQPQQMQQYYGGIGGSGGGGGGGNSGGVQQQFAGAQYGMAASGYGGYPASAWGMSWQQQQQPMVEQPAKNLIVKPGVIEPQVIARAAEWSEHRAPDGRAYYYHAGRSESVWVKPQAIRDLEAARMAAHAGISPMPPVQLPAGPIMTAMQINATPVITSPQIHKIQPHTQSIMFDPVAFALNPPEIKMDESFEAMMENKRKLEAEQKKRDDEEKARQADKSRPISTTPIDGTPWSVVWTGDGRVFFYNPSTRTSVWERPAELNDRADVDAAMNTMPEQLAHLMPKVEEKDESEVMVEAIETTASDAVETTSARRRTDSESSDHSTTTPNKKPKLETVAAAVVTPTVVTKPTVAEKKVDVGKDAAVQAEIRAARERALLPLDTRVDTFVELLKEKDVSAFSTWEKELHKIVFDQRYLLLTSRERKQCFEKYVKVRAEEEHREMRKKLRQKRDDFRALLEAAHLHGKSLFSDFSQKYGKDDRFVGIDKKRERENHFNSYIVEVRRHEKEAKQAKIEQVRKEFIALLREHSDIDRHSRWADVKKKVSSDTRYRAVDSSVQREDFFHEYCKMLKDEKKKNKEKERERKERKEIEKKDKDRHRDKDSKGKGEKDKDRSSAKDKNGDRDKEREKDKDKEKDKERSKGGNSSGGDKDRERSSKDDKVPKDKDRSDRSDRDRSDKDRGKDKYRDSKDNARSKDKKRERNNEKTSKDSGERSKSRRKDKDEQPSDKRTDDEKPERSSEVPEKIATLDSVEPPPKAIEDKSQTEESTNVDASTASAIEATVDQVSAVDQATKEVPSVQAIIETPPRQDQEPADTTEQPHVTSNQSADVSSETTMQEAPHDTIGQEATIVAFEQQLYEPDVTLHVHSDDMHHPEIISKLYNSQPMDELEQFDDPGAAAAVAVVSNEIRSTSPAGSSS